jgi:uncharacterized Zn finger protein
MMPNLEINCDNCGSDFELNYVEDEVSYTPSHCPFCGDLFESVREELDFNDEDSDYYGDGLNEDDE